MSGLKDIRIRPKLIGALLIIGLVPLVILAIIGMNVAEKSLKNEAFAKLEAVQDIKKNEVLSFFEERMEDVLVLSNNPFTKEAISNIDAVNMEVKRRTGKIGLDLLDVPEYKRIYDKYYDTFKQYIETYGYYDLFLVCPEEGDVFFTICLESDFGTELSRENTGLAHVWKEAIRSGKPALSDMEAYAPSNGAPAMFVACPVEENGEYIGVVAMQISNKAIDEIMQERSGMGKTGETYLVGFDKLMRSDSYLDPEGHSILASFGGNVRENGVDTDATNKAIAGISGSDIIIDYNGNPVLSVFSPIELFKGVNWICIAEIEQAEVEIPIRSLRKTIFFMGILITIIIALLALGLAGSIAKPIINITKIAKDIAEGDLSRSVDISQGDEIGQLADAFREMTGSLQDKAKAAEQIAEGDLAADINVASQADTLGNAMVTMKENLKKSKERTDAALEEAMLKIGYLNAVPAPVMVIDKNMNIKFMNEAGARVRNMTTDACIGKKCYNIFNNKHCNTDECRTVRAMKRDGIFTGETIIDPGNLDLPVMYSGAPLKDNKGEIIGGLEYVTDMTTVKKVVDEVNETADRLNNGDLSARALVEGAEGDYKRLIEGFNAAIENMLNPMEEAMRCLSEMAEGNLTVSIDTDYKGDLAKLKKSMNTTINALNEILGQVNISADQIADGSRQVSDSSQSLSQGATESASSLEEISSSMVEQASQTKLNAENAEMANKLAEEAKEATTIGNEQMQGMLSAMTEINEASKNISKIIKVIDEIAFQTNLLALNAAVEAARAGVHGKGFAVVADEVRNLAQRSSQAAKETTELIEGSVKKTENGTEIANMTAVGLEEIVGGITKVTDLVKEITSASKEQANGIEQINQSLGQIDQVTQSNTASAEESAAAAEELASQSNQLKQMLSKFELKQTSAVTTYLQGAPAAISNPGKSAAQKVDNGAWGSSREVTPRDVIALDDDDFNEF
jgi:methyl-accepting chemotaxis protein